MLLLRGILKLIHGDGLTLRCLSITRIRERTGTTLVNHLYVQVLAINHPLINGNMRRYLLLGTFIGPEVCEVALLLVAKR